MSLSAEPSLQTLILSSSSCFLAWLLVEGQKALQSPSSLLIKSPSPILKGQCLILLYGKLTFSVNLGCANIQNPADRLFGVSGLIPLLCYGSGALLLYLSMWKHHVAAKTSGKMTSPWSRAHRPAAVHLPCSFSAEPRALGRDCLWLCT